MSSKLIWALLFVLAFLWAELICVRTEVGNPEAFKRYTLALVPLFGVVLMKRVWKKRKRKL